MIRMTGRTIGAAAAILLLAAIESRAAGAATQRHFTGAGYKGAAGVTLGLPNFWPGFEYEIPKAFGGTSALGLRATLWMPTSLLPGGMSMLGFGVGASARFFPFKQPLPIAGGPYRGLAVGGGMDLMFVSVSYRYTAVTCDAFGCPRYSTVTDRAMLVMPAFFGECGYKYVLPGQSWMAYGFVRVGFRTAFGDIGGYTASFTSPFSLVGINFYYLLR